MENQEVKTEVVVKKVAPHYMAINPPKEHITVVRPNYCQTKKQWSTRVINEKGELSFWNRAAEEMSTRVINEKGEQLKGFIDKDKDLSEWKKLMNDFHKVSKAEL